MFFSFLYKIKSIFSLLVIKTKKFKETKFKNNLCEKLSYNCLVQLFTFIIIFYLII